MAALLSGIAACGGGGASVESSSAGSSSTSSISVSSSSQSSSSGSSSSVSTSSASSSSSTSSAGQVGRIWSSAVNIDASDTQDSLFPRAAMETDGNSFVIWSREILANLPPRPSSVWLNANLFSSWTGPNLMLNTSEVLNLAGDGNNFAAVMLSDSGDLSVSRYSSGGSWSAGSVLSRRTSTSDNYDPNVTLDADGNVLVAWIHMDQNNSSPTYRVQVSRFAGGSWIQPTTLFSKAAYSPAVAFGRDGTEWIVWTEEGGVPTSRYSTVVSQRNRLSQPSWSLPVTIDMPTGNAYRPQIVALPNGEMAAAWEQHDGTRYRIYVNRFQPGAGWGAPVTIDNGNHDASQPFLTSDQSGNLIVSWKQQDTTSIFSLWIGQYFDSAWRAPVKISSSTVNLCYAPIRIGQDGRPVIVWAQPEGVGAGVWTAQYPQNGNWNDATQVKLSTSASCPSFSMNTAGDGIATWADRSSGLLKVWASLFK